MKTLHYDVYINLKLLESFLSSLSDLHNCVGITSLQTIILTFFEKQKYCLHLCKIVFAIIATTNCFNGEEPGPDIGEGYFMNLPCPNPINPSITK